MNNREKRCEEHVKRRPAGSIVATRQDGVKGKMNR